MRLFLITASWASDPRSLKLGTIEKGYGMSLQVARDTHCHWLPQRLGSLSSGARNCHKGSADNC